VAWSEAYLQTKWHLDPSSCLATIHTGRKLGRGTRNRIPVWGGELGPHLTQSPGPRPTSIPSVILIHPAIWPQQIWAENWWLCPFGGGGAGSPSNRMWPGPRPTCTQLFGDNRHGPKIGGSAPFLGGGAGSPSNTVSLGSRPTCLPSGILIHRAIWSQQIWAENWGVLCPFGRGGVGSSSNTSAGPRPACMPSFIWIRPSVRPQYTNVTDRQDTMLCPIA